MSFLSDVSKTWLTQFGNSLAVQPYMCLVCSVIQFLLDDRIWVFFCCDVAVDALGLTGTAPKTRDWFPDTELPQTINHDVGGWNINNRLEEWAIGVSQLGLFFCINTLDGDKLSSNYNIGHGCLCDGIFNNDRRSNFLYFFLGLVGRWGVNRSLAFLWGRCCTQTIPGPGSCLLSIWSKHDGQSTEQKVGIAWMICWITDGRWRNEIRIIHRISVDFHFFMLIAVDYWLEASGSWPEEREPPKAWPMQGALERAIGSRGRQKQ